MELTKIIVKKIYGLDCNDATLCPPALITQELLLGLAGEAGKGKPRAGIQQWWSSYGIKARASGCKEGNTRGCMAV